MGIFRWNEFDKKTYLKNFKTTKMAKEYNKGTLVSFLLRLGLTVVLFYAAIASLLLPQNWIGFLPSFIRTPFMLTLFSIYEIILGLWLLSNKKTFYASVVAALTMFSIVVINITMLDLVFRDIAIFFMAVALAVLSHKKR